MPIYAYRCASCGHAQDVLQKLSDPLLTVCPACGEATYRKQLTAAGFQLKGSGWYATDFRGGNTPAKPDAEAGAKEGAKPAEPAAGDAKAGDVKGADAKGADAKGGDAKPVAAAAPAAKPAAGGSMGGATPSAT